jgi:hypothetical protein
MDLDDISTTLAPTPPTTSATLRLYDVFIPLLGVFIISLNLLVVISSGLLLKKRKIARAFICVNNAVGLLHIKADYARWLHNKTGADFSLTRAHPRLFLSLLSF